VPSSREEDQPKGRTLIASQEGRGTGEHDQRRASGMVDMKKEELTNSKGNRQGESQAGVKRDHSIGGPHSKSALYKI